MRYNNRPTNSLRPITITRNYTKYAEGSVLIECGATKVLCNATIDNQTPKFLSGTSKGWISAEYSMLPRATHTRNKRDTIKPNSRAQEISRLIGRSLRAAVDLTGLGEKQILIDCDVLQADGGTRTASISGAFIALYDAINKLKQAGVIKQNPIKQFMAAVSVGIINNVPLLDIDYHEDSNCDMDLNLVMFEDLSIIEIQATAEKKPINKENLVRLIDLAEGGISHIIELQKQSLGL